MKKSQKRSVLSTLKTPKVAVLLLFAIGFGAFGVYKLAFSSAATPVNISYFNYLNVSQMSTGTSKINDLSAPYSTEIVGSMPSPKYVTQIAPGGVLINSPPRPTFPTLTKVCYVMRSANQGNPATVEIVGWNSTRRVVPDTTSWREYCVPTADLATGGADYNIKHIRGGPVNVLQSVWYTKPMTQ